MRIASSGETRCSKLSAASPMASCTPLTLPLTILEALGIEAPRSIKGVTQSPIEGHSFAHVLNNTSAPTNHITQYFEMMGHRSIHHDGWRAVCPWPGP